MDHGSKACHIDKRVMTLNNWTEAVPCFKIAADPSVECIINMLVVDIDDVILIDSVTRNGFCNQKAIRGWNEK